MGGKFRGENTLAPIHAENIIVHIEIMCLFLTVKNYLKKKNVYWVRGVHATYLFIYLFNISLGFITYPARFQSNWMFVFLNTFPDFMLVAWQLFWIIKSQF